jgi:WD40 repeat protein
MVTAFMGASKSLTWARPVAPQELLNLSGHSGAIPAVQFSPDGKRFATASSDNTAKIWDSAPGHELLTLSGHSGGVYGIAFSPDGTRLATGGGDGTVRVYLLRIEDLVDLAKSRVTRSLAAEECRNYLHVEECPAP